MKNTFKLTKYIFKNFKLQRKQLIVIPLDEGLLDNNWLITLNEGNKNWNNLNSLSSHYKNKIKVIDLKLFFNSF